MRPRNAEGGHLVGHGWWLLLPLSIAKDPLPTSIDGLERSFDLSTFKSITVFGRTTFKRQRGGVVTQVGHCVCVHVWQVAERCIDFNAK